MRKKLLYLVLFLFMGVLLCAAADDAKEIKPETAVPAEPVKTEARTIRAVMPFEIVAGSEDTLKMVYKIFWDEFSTSAVFQSIGAEESIKILKEKGFKDISCRSTDCLVKIAGLLKAEKLIFGNITISMGKYVIELSVFDPGSQSFTIKEFVKAENEEQLKELLVDKVSSIKARLGSSKKGSTVEQDTLKKYYTAKERNKQEDNSGPLLLGAGINGGMSLLLQGYPGYTSLTQGGAEVIFKTLDKKLNLKNLKFGVAVDFLPMNTPDGAYNTSENIYCVNIFLDYGLDPTGAFNPFGGFGVGMYWDTVTADSVVAGPMEHTYMVMGVNLRIGAELAVIPKMFYIVPQVKGHFIMGPGFYFAIAVTAGGGATLYF